MMVIRRRQEYFTASVMSEISFEKVLDVVCEFADSDIPAGHFSYWEVERLEVAARLIREKLNAAEEGGELHSTGH